MDKVKLHDMLVEGCALLDISISPNQIEKLLLFASMIEETNQKMNLTRIISEQDFAIKHFVDCLALQKIDFSFNGAGIDVGSGAGFPGIVVASCLTNDKIVLLDSLEKRVKFLKQVTKQLDLQHVTCLHGRAEDLAHEKEYRSQFQWVVARAVAPLPVLLEYCVPFVEVGGSFIAMKGSNVAEELKAAENAVNTLNVTVQDEYEFELPFNMGSRTIIRFIKKSQISKEYPRKAGIPSRKPL